MTWSADTDLTARETLAASALSAYSVAAVDRGAAAVTTYAVFRSMAYDEIVARWAARGLLEGDLTNTTGLLICEAYLALSKLFESVEQFMADGRMDIFAQKRAHWLKRYEDEMAKLSPQTGRRPVGASFDWGRG